MREIKFRAWSKSAETMLYGDGLEFSFSIYKLQEAIDSFARNDDYILMQYTGLKDKNGVEIFEGDVVEFNDGWIEDEKGEFIDKRHRVIVAYDHHRFIGKLENGEIWDNGHTYEDFDDDIPFEESEVIGNRWENPHLWEAKDAK